MFDTKYIILITGLEAKDSFILILDDTTLMKLVGSSVVGHVYKAISSAVRSGPNRHLNLQLDAPPCDHHHGCINCRHRINWHGENG